MTLRECKQAIRSFIRQHWDDQRLHDVYAFNRDGRMDEMNTCSCLVGCTMAAVLHGSHEGCLERHYLDAKSLPGATETELAYMMLRWKGMRIPPSYDEEPPIQQRRLSAILRGELRRRDRVRRDLEWAYASPQEDREIAILKLASGICYLTCGDIEALRTLAEDDGQVLAEMVLNPAISGVRLRGAASAEVEL